MTKPSNSIEGVYESTRMSAIVFCPGVHTGAYVRVRRDDGVAVDVEQPSDFVAPWPVGTRVRATLQHDGKVVMSEVRDGDRS